MQRHLSRSARLTGLGALGVLGGILFASNASAQVSGTSAKPLPDVLLLVDTSGSMERMVDGSKPEDNLSSTCSPGNYSDPNRWGMLVQALTGNIQPYYSCLDVPRSSSSDFATRYSINGKKPYDTDYIFDYHQPISGASPQGCAVLPWYLPGAPNGSGVGTSKFGAGGQASDYPDDSFASVWVSTLTPGTGVYRNGITDPSTSGIPPLNACTFTQGNDGQLDATKYFARFALMTFDNDTSGMTGLGTTGTSTLITDQVDTTDPFTGQWSYLRSSSNTAGVTLDGVNAPPQHVVGAVEGRPGTVPACSFSDQEVGARNGGAPPWEGRLIGFPSEDATIYEMDSQNSQIQQTLLATRPSGATPIDGMMDDARDYYWYNPNGPKADAYTCRERYIILLTDGAPNLDLRPSCTNQPNGVCPYGGASNADNAGVIAQDLYNGTSGQKVTTYVIGFAVSGTTDAGGSGFPSGLPHDDCKTWFDSMSGATSKDKATTLSGICNGTSPPTVGTTADACCKLNDIALKGGQTGAFFAESQADIVLAFGEILADIIHSASTKTTPVFSPAVAFNAAAFASTGSTTASSAEYIASYIPNAQRPWSGEIDRTRFLCNASNMSFGQTEAKAKGDFESENLAYQSAHDGRTIITVIGHNPGTAIDSQASIRPFADQSPTSSTGGDAVGTPGAVGQPTYTGQEVAMTSYGNINSFVSPATDWPLALNVTKNTCQRGRSVKVTGGTDIIPALNNTTNGPAECSEVVWGFATAAPSSFKFPDATPSLAAGYEFNVRCINGDTSSAGTCSITGGPCTTDGVTACPTGEACVPSCSALGAIYHSTPAVLAPPQSLLREDGFRAYQQNRAARQTVMFAASTDGILHAFKALDQGDVSNNHELWSFVPPAVLPTLASNYPAGNQILLDGAPVVRETVWDRTAGNTSAAKDWHATLVASFGTFGGYYALNVTDADCAGSATECRGTGFQPANDASAVEATSGAETSGDTTGDPSAKRGPHFLWQLTDVPSTALNDNASLHRTSSLGNTKMAALFGKNTGTPAVGMVDIKDASGVDHQVGVAILPGGYENPPLDATKYSCPRRPKAAADVYADTAVGYRASVRQWASNCTTAPVPGRGVTIVRLDNGEIIKHFGRMNSGVPQDAPVAIAPSVIDTPFDSPMIGTPVVYPDQVGVPIQKVFIGDADGTLWRIDLTSTNPNAWHANLFADLIAPAGSTAPATTSEPISVPPVLSTDDAGNLVVNAATGDQESIVVSTTETNYLYSITETRDGSNPPRPLAKTNWYVPFANAERVTGPMVVFDKTLYFASYLPQHPSGGVCTSLGTARLWGLDYATAKTAGTLSSGGVSKWCPAGNTDVVTGLCAGGVALIDYENQGSDIIPGVALQASQACVTDMIDDYGNTAFASFSSASYSLSFGIARPNATGSTPPQAARNTIKRPLPVTQTRIDSWSIVLN